MSVPAYISSLAALGLVVSLTASLTAVHGADHEMQRLSFAERAAVAALEKLGAKVRVAPSRKKNADGKADDGKSAPAVTVIIAKEWTGVDSDLQRAATLSTLQGLYVVGEGKVTDEALEKLRAACPRATIRRTPAVRLGIAVSSKNEPVKIERIERNSAANRAGFQSGDILVKFAGEPVKDFEELVFLTVPLKAGEKVDVELLRDGKKISATVEFSRNYEMPN